MYDENALIDDVRQGLTDSEIMQKYHMAAAEYREKILLLSRERVLRYSDIYWRPILYDYNVSGDDRRSLPRYPLKLLLPVEEKGSLEATPGFLIDINEKGGCLQGIQAELGSKIALVIYPEGLIPADSITLEGIVQWVDDSEGASVVAGFEIANIAEPEAMLLRELIRKTIRHD